MYAEEAFEICSFLECFWPSTVNQPFDTCANYDDFRHSVVRWKFVNSKELVSPPYSTSYPFTGVGTPSHFSKGATQSRICSAKWLLFHRPNRMK